MYQTPQRKGFDKRNLWPWRDWMTIAIGVLGSEAKRPDHIVLLADTQGSFGSAYLMNRLHKLFKDEALDLYAVGADQIDKAAELFGILQDCFRLFRQEGKYGSLVDSLEAANWIYRRARFRFDVVGRQFGMAPHLIPEPFDRDILPEPLRKPWKKFYVGCQMIVGTFDYSGQALLFLLDGNGGVSNLSFPGFAAIGSGVDNAMFWLSYRNHNLGLSVKAALYHAYEAKVMAESSAFVNDKMDVVIAKKGNCDLISDIGQTPRMSGQFSIKELRDLFELYGPRSTQPLTP
jgi:hypothetical protein